MRACRLIIAGGIAAALAAQRAGPGEVRISSRPYVLSTLRAETNLVEVGVVVRDSHGRAIPGLTQNDFKILDDGKPREIVAFSIDAAAPPAAAADAIAPKPRKDAEEFPDRPAAAKPRKPRFIAIFFDDVNTGQGDLRHADIAAQRFVKEMLMPGDRAAIFTASGTQNADFTEDVPKLVAAIERVRAHPRISDKAGGCPRITQYQAYLIANRLDDSMYRAVIDEAYRCAGSATEWVAPPSPTARFDTMDPMVLDNIKARSEQMWEQTKEISQNTLESITGVADYLAKMPGERIVLVASSGFLSGMLDVRIDRLIDHALRSNVVINSLDAKGLYAETPGRPIDEELGSRELGDISIVREMVSLGARLEETDAALGQMAQSTGGLFYHNNNDLNFGFYLLGVMPEITYRMAFSANGIKMDGQYHKLKVHVARTDSELVQFRPGYVAMARDYASAGGQEFDHEVRAADARSDFPGTMTAAPGELTVGQTVILVRIHVDVSKLRFDRQNDRHMQGLHFVAALFNSAGDFVTGKEASMNLALKNDTYERLQRDGIDAVLSLSPPAGSYRLRCVIEDGVEKKIAASSQTVDFR